MKKIMICLLALASSAMPAAGSYAATDQDRVSAVIELQDADVASLKQTGFIKMAIPPGMRDRVASVILKRPVRFKDDSAVLFNDVDRRSGMVSIKIDDSTMEQIDYQPVELKIYESGFSSIVVQYQPGNSRPTRKASKNDSAVFVTSLTNTKSLTGRIADMKEFSIKSGLGVIDVDLDEVSQITFEDDSRANVMLENGDKLSGKISFKDITINSRWGLEDLKVADIVSITKPISSPVSPNLNPSVTDMMQQNMAAVPTDASMTTPQTFGINEGLPMEIPTFGAPQPISIPAPAIGIPAYSPLQSFSYPSGNAFDQNGQRIDLVPEPLNQPVDQAYDPYSGQQVFDQAIDQLMQPIDPAMQPVEMMPMGQNFGPFFGEPVPVGEQPVGGFGEIIQSRQGAGIQPNQTIPENGAPAEGSDFWFFPQ